MDARKITCMAAATFVGSMLILSATSPVHSAARGGANPQITAAFEGAKSGRHVAATALIISTAH
jgi:hypothetical protein